MAFELPEERAIIKMTKYSHMITLPKLWLQQFGLTKGDKVKCEITDTSDLLIKAKKERVNI